MSTAACWPASRKAPASASIRRRLNGEIWFPTGAEETIQARILLVKGIRQHSVVRFYDYKRFRVEPSSRKDAKVVPEKAQ